MSTTTTRPAKRGSYNNGVDHTPQRDTWRYRIDPVEFEGIGPCFYEVGPKRAPLKGEYYLSGAIVMAYRAPSDFSPHATYHIVRATAHAVRVQRWVRGRAIMPVSPVPVHTVGDEDSTES